MPWSSSSHPRSIWLTVAHLVSKVLLLLLVLLVLLVRLVLLLLDAMGCFPLVLVVLALLALLVIVGGEQVCFLVSGILLVAPVDGRQECSLLVLLVLLHRSEGGAGTSNPRPEATLGGHLEHSEFGVTWYSWDSWCLPVLPGSL